MRATTAPQERLPGVRQGPLPYKWMAVITTCSATLFATVTMGIVTISLPNIAVSLNASLATIQWVITIYPLVTVSTMLALGYASDVLGRRRIFTLGAFLFAVGSFLCGLAQDSLQLIGFRVVQSLGAAMIVANSAAIVTDAFPPEERGRGLGMISTVASFGLAVGPGVGGLIVEAAGWRWVFFVSVPLTLVTMTLATLYLRDRHLSARPTRQFDFRGAALLSAVASSFLLALSEGQENGWLQWNVVVLVAAFVAATVAFVRVELRVAVPTVDLRLLRQRLFAAAIATGLIGYTGMYAAMFLMPFYLIRTAGYSDSQAGALMMAIPVAMGSMAFASGWLSDRVGSRWPCAGGIALITISFFLMASLGRTAGFFEAGLPLLLCGLGVGLFMTPNNSVVMGFVPASRLGMASAIVGTVRHLGVAMGVAVGGAVFAARLAAYSPPGTSLDSTLFDPAASVGAFRDAYLVVGLICAIGVMTSLMRGKEGGSAR